MKYKSWKSEVDYTRDLSEAEADWLRNFNYHWSEEAQYKQRHDAMNVLDKYKTIEDLYDRKNKI